MSVTAALRPLDRVQIGLEGTAGTAVAAIAQLLGQGYLQEMIERDRGNEARGLRATAGPLITLARWTEMKFAGDLTPHDLLFPLCMGLKGDPAISGSGPYVWTFDPALTAAPTLKSATIECRHTDGTTAHVYVESQFNYCTGFKVSFGGAKARAKMEFSTVGRARQSSTLTAAISPLTNRDTAIMVGGLAAHYIDDAGASLGTTQLTGIVRSVDWEVNTGIAPDFTQDNRSGLDHGGIVLSNITGKVRVVLELDANGALEYADWRGNTRRFIRSKVEISSDYIIQLNAAVDFTSAVISEDGDTKIVTLDGEMAYDTTWGKIFTAVVTVDDVANVAALTGA